MEKTMGPDHSVPLFSGAGQCVLFNRLEYIPGTNQILSCVFKYLINQSVYITDKPGNILTIFPYFYRKSVRNEVFYTRIF